MVKFNFLKTHIPRSPGTLCSAGCPRKLNSLRAAAAPVPYGNYLQIGSVSGRGAARLTLHPLHQERLQKIKTDEGDYAAAGEPHKAPRTADGRGVVRAEL